MVFSDGKGNNPLTEISFEFIQHPDLKASLVSDYREMIAGQQSACWKSVHVLAGSIIEALLVDELVFNHPTEEARILNNTFEKLIERCQNEGLLTRRAVNLSTVVRGYRNLVHPGRLVRLQETIDEDGANTAVALVRMVLKEVAVRRIDTYGPTAEQVVEKIRIDPTNRAAHARLIDGLKENEVVRLAVETIPACLLTMDLDHHEDYQVAVALGNATSLAFTCFPTDQRWRMSSTYADLIKRGSSVDITCFERMLFSGGWLVSASEEDRGLIIDHLVDKFDRIPEAYADLVRACAPYTDYRQFYEIVDHAAVAMFRSDLTDDEKTDCKRVITETCCYVERSRIELVKEVVESVAADYAHTKPKITEFLRSIKSEIAYDPFADE